MRPFKVALGLAKLTGLQLLSLATKIITMLTGNTHVTTPFPDIPTLTVKRDNYKTKKENLETAKSNLKTAAAEEKQAKKELKDALTTEARTVDNVAQGDKAIIESTGMPASQDADPTHMEQVENLSISRGDDHGWVDCHWDSMEKQGARNYTVRTSAQAPDGQGNAPWVVYTEHPTKSSVTLKGFTPGSSLWVEVCANGANGAGAFSDPAFIIVP